MILSDTTTATIARFLGNRIPTHTAFEHRCKRVVAMKESSVSELEYIASELLLNHSIYLPLN